MTKNDLLPDTHHVPNQSIQRPESFVDRMLPRDGSQFAQDWSLAQAVALSGYFRDLDGQNAQITAAQAMVKIQQGRDLGISPMASIRNIHIIKDKGIAIGAHVMSALIRIHGAEFTVWQMDEM